MAFAISESRTVLWDQFEYTGSPQDFSWVLPIAPGAYVEASSDAWFDSLEAVTATSIQSERLSCAPPPQDSSGCCYGAVSTSDSGGLASAEGGGGGAWVQVVSEATVGPYETVTLRATEANALQNWLTSHGYRIPPDIYPLIDAYVDEGADFLALRLAPGHGVQQMTPVRVVTPHGEPILPLRMVAAGTGDQVAITLYVIAEERYTMPDLVEQSIDFDKLTWDFQTSSSNYPALRSEVLALNDGHSLLTTFARPGAFWQRLPTVGGNNATFTAPSYAAPLDTFADLYFATALGADAAPCLGTSQFQTSAWVVDCEGALGCPGEGEQNSDVFACAGHTDIEAAMIGMRPEGVWITRLEMDLPRSALVMDCSVTPKQSQVPVANWHRAAESLNPPCEPSVFTNQIRRRGPTDAWVLGFAAVGAVFRRRSSKRRS